jgi:hypothetical protein
MTVCGSLRSVQKGKIAPSWLTVQRCDDLLGGLVNGGMGSAGHLDLSSPLFRLSLFSVTRSLLGSTHDLLHRELWAYLAYGSLDTRET